MSDKVETPTKPVKLNAEQRRAVRREVNFPPGKKCPACGDPMRPMYKLGFNRWKVCRRGHKIFKKKARRD